MAALAREPLDLGTDDLAEADPGTNCRPVTLRGHMHADGGGYVSENDAFYEALTEPHPDPKFEHTNPARMRVGRHPMEIPLDVLTASGHTPRRTRQIVSAYRAGMDEQTSEGPTARTHKELRAICHQCAENRAEIRRCAVINCPIWPYRMGKNPHNPKRGKNPFT